MFAGKSTELLRRVRKHEIAGKRCLYIKYIEDTRYDVTSIATHDNLKRQAVAVREISEVGDDWKSFDVIGIDEGQFFTDIVAKAEEMAEAGKIVAISALGGTYLRQPFNGILDLVPKCEKII